MKGMSSCSASNIMMHLQTEETATKNQLTGDVSRTWIAVGVETHLKIYISRLIFRINSLCLQQTQTK